jgi:hypothetical protein
MVDTERMFLARWVIVGGLLGLLAIGVIGSLVALRAWDRVSSRPLDMTQVRHRIGFQTPAPVLAIIKRDGFAYRAHAALALVIERADGDPVAAGVQWVKAGAHARTNGDLKRVTHGLLTAQQHSSDPLTLESTLCAYVENGHWTGLQREAFDSAGLKCPEYFRGAR